MDNDCFDLVIKGATELCGILDRVNADRENQRKGELQIIQWEEWRKDRYDKRNYKLAKKRQKYERQKEQHDHELAMEQMRIEKAKQELEYKYRAYEAAIAAEERMQKDQRAAAERIANKKIEFFNYVFNTVNNFYIPLINDLRGQLSEMNAKISPDIPQGERIQLQKQRDNLYDHIDKAEEKFNRCIADLNNNISKIQIQVALPESTRKLLADNTRFIER